jgi:hypothetical protein
VGKKHYELSRTPLASSGFGVADNSAGWQFNVLTPGQQTRERGSNYLTMLEGTGVIGTLPFVLLMLSLIRSIWRVFLWLRYTGNPSQPAVVAACILLGCFVNATFEDWMLAVGYYMCVIFWVVALSLRDWMECPARSETEPVPVRRFGSVLRTGSPVPR